MIVCIVVGGVFLIAFAAPTDAINATLSTSGVYQGISSQWKNDSGKELLLVAQRGIGILLIIIGVGNFLLTAVRRQEIDDVNMNGYSFQYGNGRY